MPCEKAGQSELATGSYRLTSIYVAEDRSGRYRESAPDLADARRLRAPEFGRNRPLRSSWVRSRAKMGPWAGPDGISSCS